MDPATRLLHALGDPAAGMPASPDLALSSYLVASDQGTPAEYGRSDQPNWRIVEMVLGALEDAEAVLFPSGQAAAHALLWDVTRSGRRVVMPDNGYYNSRALAEMMSTSAGISCVTTDHLEMDAVASVLDGPAAVLWVETPSNPLLRVADLAALSELAAAHDALMVSDNTLATPLLQQPFDFGSWANVYSLTKALGGHSDLLLGAVVSRDAELIARLREWRTLTGVIPGAFAAWLAARSLKTLAVRLQRQCENALAVAGFLQRHARVTAVHYPGLPPARSVADRQMRGGYGPLLSFEIDGDARRADAVVRAARLVYPGTSFGGVGSSWERRARWAGETAPATLIRLAVGVEHADDLIADIDRALHSA
ncbi:MAG TPA: aminotransferase class I/II-fold pyridoxal phosphate-dependent enzyme [Euzebyales bacterium]|nr:aminotransferase class I/II-fold pyridoxal phosphate-dependent enzyme [Euzebyales bacterium]